MPGLDGAEAFAEDDAEGSADDDVERQVRTRVDAGEGDEDGEAEAGSAPRRPEVGGGDGSHGEGHGAVAGGVAEADAVVPDVEAGAEGSLALDEVLDLLGDEPRRLHRTDGDDADDGRRVVIPSAPAGTSRRRCCRACMGSHAGP